MKKYFVLLLIVVATLFTSNYVSASMQDQVFYTDSIPPAPTPNIPEPTTPYTLEEVKKHNTKTDCWTVVMGSVYDVTRFIDQHPGRDGILKGCGLDSSVIFNTEDNHTPVRRSLLKGYKIGILVDNKKD